MINNYYFIKIRLKKIKFRQATSIAVINLFCILTDTKKLRKILKLTQMDARTAVLYS